MSLHTLKTTAIQLGLVLVGVKVHKAAEERGGVEFNQLHKDCGERIKMPKTCPVHGGLRSEQIVKGTEVAPGEYVLISEEEVSAITEPPGQPLHISKLVPVGSVGFAQDTYYLAPDKMSGRAYALLRDTMAKANVEALTQITFRGRPHLATLRAAGDLIVLTTHHWPSEVRDATGLVPATPPPSEAEIKMAASLVKGMTGTFDEAEHVDTYQQLLEAIIADKIAGRPVTATVQPEAPAPTQDLMAVLQASLAKHGLPEEGHEAAPANQPKGRKKVAA